MHDDAISESVLDLTCSLQLLSESFTSWHRFHKDNIGIVRYEDVRKLKTLPIESLSSEYPLKFQLLCNTTDLKSAIVIGSGKYAKVYNVRGRAYKVIKIPSFLASKNEDKKEDEKADTEKRISNLSCNLREFIFYHSLHHLNIMKPITSQIVMEYGKIIKMIHCMPRVKHALSDLINSQQISTFKTLIQIIYDVLSALAYMHEKHIAHGDLKPANVLVDGGMTATLTDFSLTFFDNRGKEISFGTLGYRAPECLLERDYSIQSDIWSLGFIILDCLYGCSFSCDILKATTNQELLERLPAVLGFPNELWVTSNLIFPRGGRGDVENINKKDGDIQPLESKELNTLPNENDATLPTLGIPTPFKTENIVKYEILIGETGIKMSLNDTELQQVNILLKAMLQWNPQDRKSARDILRNEVFQGLVPRLHKPMDKIIKIKWKNKQEKLDIRQQVLGYYQEVFKKLPNEYDESMIADIILLVKRLNDRLLSLQCTFHPSHIIQMACSLHFFSWYSEYQQDDLFESSIYHVLSLSEFQVLNLHTIEEFEDIQHVEQVKKPEVTSSMPNPPMSFSVSSFSSSSTSSVSSVSSVSPVSSVSVTSTISLPSFAMSTSTSSLNATPLPLQIICSPINWN